VYFPYVLWLSNNRESSRWSYLVAPESHLDVVTFAVCACISTRLVH